MARFTRTQPAPTVRGDYGAFRPFVRADFEQRCAFCLFHELFAGGERNFELDHFRPLWKFRHLRRDFLNLYWTCHPCNKQKLDTWPPDELLNRGIGFVDLCSDDFDDHFQEGADGRWIPRTPSAEYTLERLDLNNAHLVRLRLLLRAYGVDPYGTPPEVLPPDLRAVVP